MRLLDRAGALIGLLGIALLVLAFSLADPSSTADVGPGRPAEAVARTLADRADLARAGATILLAASFCFTVFFARLHGALRNAMAVESWLPGVAAIAGAAFLAVLVLEGALLWAASEADLYVFDPHVAKTLVVLGWNAAFLFAPALTAMMIAVTAAALTTTGFPRWLGWLGLLLLAGVLVLAALGLAGLATFPGMTFLVLVSILLTVRP